MRLCSHALILALCAAFASLGGVGCDASAESGAEGVNAEVWIASVRQAHAAADDAETPARRLEAAAALDALAQEPAPAEVAATHSRAVRQDLYFRVATFAARSGDHERARAAASAGLELGRGRDVLTANLLIARGEAAEALGDPGAASADYYDALRINEELLDAVLGDAEDAP